MAAVFLKLLNMSIAASWLVLAVIILRGLLKKAPKWINCLLWGIVALRLIVPFTVETAFSLIPSAEVIPQDIVTSQTPAIHSGIPAVNNAVNPLFITHAAPVAAVLEKLLAWATTVWLAGVAILLLYSAVTYLRLRWQVRISLPCGNNVYVCDDVVSPFILGSILPRIYIPSGMDGEPLKYVLAHETAHLKRRDHWWKPLGFLVLTVYWFNPLLWLAYILLCRDIEQACDEKVIAGMDNSGKKGYSEALVACSVHRRMIMACPVAFGEQSVKSRIRGIVRYRKPGFWVLLASTVVCIITAACFLTNPKLCPHVYGSEITEAPSCTQTGMQTHTCELCQHSYNTCAQMLAHAYDEGVVTEQPTCTQTGTKEFACTACGAKKTETVEIVPHTAGEPTYIKEPNCTEKGEVSATCTACRAVFVVEILETNDTHDVVETVLRQATCTASGEGRLSCKRCDYTESCTYEKLGHNYQDGRIIEGTCTMMGQKQSICTRCGDSYWMLTNTTDHRWEAYGTNGRKCTSCGFINPGSSSMLDGVTNNNTYQAPTYAHTPTVQIPQVQLPTIPIWP